MTSRTSLRLISRSVAVAILGLVVIGTDARAADNQPTLDELLGLTPSDESREEKGDDAAGSPGEQTIAPAETGSDAEAAAGHGKGASQDEVTRLTQEVMRLLEGQGEQPAAGELVAEMDQVAQRLSVQLDPGVATQRVQQSVITRLDQLIAQAQQQQQQSSSSSSGSSGGQASARMQDQGQQGNEAQGQNQGDQGQAGEASQAQQAAGEKAAENSGVAGGEAGGAEEGAFEAEGGQWGNLPPRLRDELQQGMGEQFSSVYKYLTEAYYRRLAEEAN